MSDIHMRELKSNLLILNEYIENKEDIIYIDYPLYHNVGDLLIYQGALSFFKENNIKIKCFRSVYDCNVDELKKIVTPQTTFICQGGGNFGDIYESHQSLREKIVSEFINNRIIILPQTSHYSKQENLDRSINIFRQHPDVVLFARDTQTFDTFKKLSDKSFLLPDMAHNLYDNLNMSPSKRKETLYFLRNDVEINNQQNELSIDPNVHPIDWDDFINSSDLFRKKVIGGFVKLSKLTNSEKIRNITSILWMYHCRLIVNRAAVYFSSYSDIVTSRMHGHILSCLVNVPNKIIDNSYGKNSGYFKQWTSKVKGAQLFNDSK